MHHADAVALYAFGTPDVSHHTVYFKLYILYGACTVPVPVRVRRIIQVQVLVLPILVQRGLLGQVFTINGVNYPTDDGTVIRDYTHVSDVARAFVATTHWIIDQQLSGVLNIGNNNPVSMLELVKEVEEQLDTTIETHNAVERDGDMIQTHADISTTEKVLGWQPALSIKDIVADEIKWQKIKLKKLL